MDGRFPFDSSGGRRPPQLSAQVRAALGLQNLDEAYYLQHAQQQQQNLQRNLQLRQLLLQEQFDQQMQEQQLRAIGEQLHDYPDLQSHYRAMLLNEQMRQGNLSGLGGGQLAAAAHQQQQQQQQQQAALLRERAEMRALEEHLLRQQQQQQHYQQQPQQQQRQISGGFRREEIGSPQLQTHADLLVAAAQRQQQQQQHHQQQISSPQIQTLTQNLSALEALSKSTQPTHTSTEAQVASASLLDQSNRPLLDRAQSYSQETEDSIPQAVPKAVPQAVPKASPQAVPKAVQAPAKKRSASRGSSDREKKAHATKKQKKKKTKTTKKPKKNTQKLTPDEIVQKMEELDELPDSPVEEIAPPDESNLEAFALAADMMEPEIITRGTVDGLLEAAKECDEIDDAAAVLATKMSEVEYISDSDDEYGMKSAGFDPDAVAEFCFTPYFKSVLPKLPEEPIFEEDQTEKELSQSTDLLMDDRSERKKNGEDHKSAKQKKASVAEYPFPIDTWWPSVSGMRRERRACGETSDEENFDETPSYTGEQTKFRANERKIEKRLASLQPGVLEKLPHCRLHRVRTKRKKDPKTPELVYCFQVTEIYPNDVMVNCSRCGTWRHAACGGHYESYSVRKNVEKPFVAVCENCHEEDKYLKESPQGEQRIERQRTEQLRRGLSTSSVMRHFSYSKHGGTYKWPLGSVSATHIGGHTRSVHARHDKAEKQWSDMGTRLGRGYGYRQKERVRSRTKELERLLSSIEDAEGSTDRHNMFLFLQRDTEKDKPAGFENEFRNIFDPADDVVDGVGMEDPKFAERAVAAKAIMPYEGNEENNGKKPVIKKCIREGCERNQRFDSKFCSDACGVSTLEADLLRTLQEASDIHPSVLRATL